jgi:hypothetical protein
MALLPTQVVAPTGTALTFTAASGGGDTCVTGSDVQLYVKNGSGSSITVTLATPGTVDGDLAIADRTVTVAAGAETAVPMTDLYRNPSTGVASITYSAVTTVTVAVVR